MKRVALLFPDYGSQYVGMAKELYDTSRVMQEYFDEASNCLGINFIKLCFASSEQELFKIEQAYAALFLTSSALACLLKEQGIIPCIVAGYGIGEFSAIHVAGGLSLPDSLYLLNKYALFFSHTLQTSTMSVARVQGINLLSLKKLCILSSNQTDRVHITGYLNDQEYVVSGTPYSMELLKQGLTRLKGSFQQLHPQVGYHSQEMIPVTKELKKYLTKVDFKTTSIPVAMSVDGKILQQGDFIRRRLIKQLYSPIRWDKIMKLLGDCDCIIQVGPGKDLAELAKKYYPDKPMLSFCKKSDMSTVSNMISL